MRFVLNRHLGRIRALSLIFVVLFMVGSSSGQNALSGRARLVVNYDDSPYADYLYFLLYRVVGPFPDLPSQVPLTGIQVFKGDTFLPVEVAQGGITTYADHCGRSSSSAMRTFLRGESGIFRRAEVRKSGLVYPPAIDNFACMRSQAASSMS